MLFKTLYVRFYKSFNYDYLRKSDLRAKPDPWDKLPGDLFYPFVRIPHERGITTVVGGNGAGKSQCLSAIKCLLTGEGIERHDFCRYSVFFAVDKKMAVPEFGGEFYELEDETIDAIRSVAKIDAEVSIESFWLFRFSDRTSIYVHDGNEVIEVEVKPPTLKKIDLPTFFEINANIPLPNSVPIDYLVASASSKTVTSRGRTLNVAQKVVHNLAWFATPETIQQSAPAITKEFADSGTDEIDLHLAARLSLAENLLVRVAHIDKSAFEELQVAVKTSEGYANGLVDKMNKQMAEALNFPKWWSQDSEFALYLTLRDFDLVFTVRDRTGSDYSFSERSGGMSYFLSYFVQYLSHDPTGSPEILLMDEPDAYLSTTGQQDLLRILADFAAPEDDGTRPVQVVYVTHSPFLIDKNHGERIRVLEKGDGEEGTRVVRDASRNHYEPLRSAFGAFVAETTFISNCNLMMEGQADQVLLAGLSSLARRLGCTGDTLDLNSLSLVPAGSAEHIPYMVYLARGRDVDAPAVTVLLDSDKAGQDIAKELRRGYRGRKLIDDDFVISVGELDSTLLRLAVSAVQEIEDLIPADIAALAVKRFATEVLDKETADLIAKNLKPIEPPNGAKLFKTAQAAAKDACPDQDAPLRLDKVGFARAVLHVAEYDADDQARNALLENFSFLYTEINRAQRAALRRNNRERITKTLNRLRRNFTRDHPVNAHRREVEQLLEDVLAQLVDTSPEAETIRDDVRRIRADFTLNSEPSRPVDDYDRLKSRLESLIYEPIRRVQDLE